MHTILFKFIIALRNRLGYVDTLPSLSFVSTGHWFSISSSILSKNSTLNILDISSLFSLLHWANIVAICIVCRHICVSKSLCRQAAHKSRNDVPKKKKQLKLTLRLKTSKNTLPAPQIYQILTYLLLTEVHHYWNQMLSLMAAIVCGCARDFG